ncbi:MAG: seryl-tRNA synthetase, partial [Nocardioidaceae bacterium]|nr:seryl-tRNA synthetase [Nocardioidaceae bacterium]
GAVPAYDFPVRDHLEIGEVLGAIDMERGAKVSGSRFYFLTGVGAQLELALINLAMEQARDSGFTQVIAPSLVRPRAMEGTGFLGQAADDVYRIEGEDLYLVGTSEVPMAAYHSDEILDAATLPLRYAAFSPCFRKEAGSHGKDTKGIIRVHWFDKVEMFVYTTTEESEAEHQRLLAWEKEFLDKLELAYRVIDVAAGDLGLSAVRKFDCEAWIPTQERYRELTSTSNCTEFQARRLDIRGRFPSTGSGHAPATRPLSTLNGTLCAMTRTIVAILETHQNADGSVTVPQALRPHMGGLEVLKPVHE